ncbi:MAG: response regulator [Pseudomonadota bacterium]
MHATDHWILIVEDSETQAVLLGSILEANGWQTRWCATAEQALESLFENNYSLIIVDFHLPGMNGDQFCRNAKMDINSRSIPILMFTVEDSPESQNAALESGTDYFVSKETDKDLLVAKISSILAQSTGSGLLEKSLTSFRRSRILAVDDSPTFLVFLEESFKTEGITLDTAESGEMALAMIEKKEYDCILLDLVMPDMDGIAVCKMIVKKKLRDNRPIFVMMLTAHEDKTEMMRALEAGADDFVGKSNDISIIKSRLSALLRRRYIQLDNQRIWRKLKENELKAERARIEKEAAEEKAKIAQQLNDSEERFEKIFENNSDGVVILDQAGKVLMMNASAEGYLGENRHKLLGDSFPHRLDNKEMSTISIENFDGSHKIVEIKTVEIPWGEMTAYLLSMRNVTERELQLKKTAETLKKAMEELTASQSQLIEAEKLGALGVLTAGIAHELNNPMMGMLNYAQYSLKHVPKTNRAFTVLQDMEREIRRCIDIVKNLLTFSRMEKSDEERFEEVHCPVMIDRVLNLLNYRIEKENVTVIRKDRGITRKIEARPSNLQQVFLNLIGNAVDALSEVTDKTLIIHGIDFDDHVQIEIIDTGPGIKKEVLTSIFNPFFTTKPVGKGTGLGLSVSRSIVQSHQGEITCESKPGSGTTFRVKLPRTVNGYQKDKTLHKAIE